MCSPAAARPRCGRTMAPSKAFEWQAGSLFALPLNAWYQHFNGQGDQEARLLSVTTAPLIFNLFHCEDFVINNPYSFTDRFKGEEGYLRRQRQAL